MARRTVSAMADIICDRVDKSRNDTTFHNFAQDMLNLSLQEIIAEVPWARWIRDEDTITTTASQQYVTLPSDMDIDSFVSMRDETTDRVVRRITPQEADLIDPGRDMTGDEILWWFQRVGTEDRIYFLYQPDSADTLTLMFGNLVDDTAAGSTMPIPAKYESILMDGALAKVWERVDPDAGIIQLYEQRFRDGIQNRIKRDANLSPGGSEVIASHRPRQVMGVEGASFPSNFDVRP